MSLLSKIFSKNKDAKINEKTYGTGSLISEDKKLYIVTDSIKNKEILPELNNRILETLKLKDTKNNIKGSLRETLDEINEELYAKEIKDISLVCFYETEKYLIIAHIGNVKLYVYSENELKQLTEDDSEAYQLFKYGIISYERLQEHPFNEVLSNSLGKNKKLILNMHEYYHTKGDKVLIGDNNFFKKLSFNNIEDILSGSDGVERIALDLKADIEIQEDSFIVKCY